jgi:uncharacterized membrane protein YhaH (DUF805 family)
MLRYLGVYFSPFGRLPQQLYWVYGVPVVIGATCFQIYLDGLFAEKNDPASALWLVPLFLLYWMAGCVSARRLRDVGFTGSLPLAIAVFLSIYAACAYFPEFLLGDADAQSQSFGVLNSIHVFAKLLFRVTCAGCAMKPGDAGPNAYGPPLGTRTAKEQAVYDAARKSRVETESSELVAQRQRKKAALLAQTIAAPAADTAPRRPQPVANIGAHRLQQATRKR